jgi:glucan phosphoethanolaminetransferase (alkaline phosphatase superfamily)
VIRLASVNKLPAQIVVAVLLALLMLPNFIWLVTSVAAPRWDEGLVFPILLLLFLFSIFGTRIWLACLLLAPFATLAPLECFYIATYHRPTSAEILGTISATNPGETIGYFGWSLLPLTLSMLLGLSLSLLAARLSYRAQIEWSGRTREWTLASGLILPTMVWAIGAFVGKGSIYDHLASSTRSVKSMTQPIESGYPFGIIPRLWEYRSEWKAMYSTFAELSTFRFHSRLSSPTQRRQVYILVIGESSRRDHWQLFGYGRATNPELAKVHNLVRITDMVNSWPESIMAIPLLLTRKPITSSSFAWNEASILRAMSEAGYETWWISNQLPLGKFDSPISTYALDAQHRLFLNHASWTVEGSYDEDLIEPLRKVLLQSNPRQNLFIVLHMMGSHIPYDLRYPPSFRHFTPLVSDRSSKVLQGLRYMNSYDNTILYTDHVLAQVITVLSESDSISALWFESDHGETLPTPTCSYSGHGIGSRYDYAVPGLFWYSDAYAAEFPDRVAQLRINANNRVMSASTFESLIDMAGVTFPSHDETWSLFSSEWHYRPRIVNSLWQANFDKSQLGKGCEVVIPAKP